MSKKQEEKHKLKQQNKRLINKYKRKGCKLCNEKELCCLEFHHINPETKIDAVMNMLSEPSEILEEEINKCVVLCANCHRKVHAGLVTLN